MSLVSIRDLSMSYDLGGGKRRHALRNVDLEIGEGEIVAVVGESGSGKSTLAKAIARLIQPTGGEIHLGSENVLKTQPRRATKGYRQQVQMVFQDPFASLNPVHSIAHHIVRPLKIHGKSAGQERAQAAKLLTDVGLTPAEAYLDQLPHGLSGGQRQRVAIARALAPEPRLLIADEPTSMLDVSIRMSVLELLKGLRERRGVSILLITHDLASAAFLADRVMVLYAGRVMELAPSEALGAGGAHPYTQLLVAAAPGPGKGLRDQLPASPGLPPTVDLPTGCVFAERCGFAESACHKPVPLYAAGTNHHVRCVRAQEDR